MLPKDLAPATPTVAAPKEAPAWLWAVLGLWILSTGVLAAVLAPVDVFKGAFCSAALPKAPAPRP